MFEGARKLYETASAKEACHGCHKAEFVALSALSECCMCGGRFCKCCRTKAKDCPPVELLQSPKLETQKTFYICNDKCRSTLVHYWMSRHREEMIARLEDLLSRYLSSNESLQLDFFPMPKNAAEDTNGRRALRLARVAELAATLSGFSTTFKAIKYLYYSKEIVSRLIAGDMLTLLGPIMESLLAFGINGPTGVLNVYYMGCQHTMEKKSDPGRAARIHTEPCAGLLFPSCPVALLDVCGEYLKAAQWLYACTLPHPHDDNEWSAWYLTKLASRHGYTVLACFNDTTKLPNDQKCPAFALLVKKTELDEAVQEDVNLGFVPDFARKFLHSKSSTQREAVLAIRGSSSTMDWSINLNEAADQFKYYSLDAATGETFCVDGRVHCGMHQGALGILDGYSLRQPLAALAAHGYNISVVGHSLGAGTAAIIAAELHNGFLLSSSAALRQCAVAGGIRAFCYATPPIFSEDIADAIFADQLVLNCIHQDDAVPRFSRVNMKQLAKDVMDFAATAERWRNKDIDCVKSYAASIGKAADMVENEPPKPSTVPAPSAPVAVAVVAAQQVSSPAAKDSVVVVAATAAQSQPSPVTAAPSTAPTASSVFGWVKSSVNTATAAVSTATATVSATTACSATVSTPSAPVAAPTATPSAPPLPAEELPSLSDMDALTAAAMVQAQQLDSEPALVVPGLILQIYRGLYGEQCAALIDHQHESMQQLRMLLDRFLDEHVMKSHWQSLRSLRLQSFLAEPHSSTVPNHSRSFNRGARPLLQPLEQTIRAEKTTTATTEPTWSVCGVCELDCNWCYILHSDGNRGLIASNCSVCGKLVCPVCSPAGDSIPGDGLNNTVTLPDWRIAAPVTLHTLAPQRVCVLCYMDSYNII